MKPVDLRSDTVTRPTPEMYAAIASAPLGDDVLGDEPTVMELEKEAARMVGKQLSSKNQTAETAASSATAN